MIDAGFIKILITLGLGALIGAALNHFFSGQRWKAELRNSEVSYWRDFSDRLSSAGMLYSEVRSLVPAARLPTNPESLMTGQVEKLQELDDLLDSLGAVIKRAPEPLTDHVRLFGRRMRRARDDIPYDIGLANTAIVEFRSALDEYVHRGKTRRAQQI